MMKYLSLVFALLVSTSSFLIAEVNLEYHLGMPQPHTHYFEVETVVKGYPEKYVDVKMAVWTPGSYLIREYPKNVEQFEAKDLDGNDLTYEKKNKNTWRIFLNSPSFKFSYKVYAFEMSVRTSFLDADHGYLNPASVFMYLDGYLDHPAKLRVQPFKDWKTISTGLYPVDQSNPWLLDVPNFDVLADSPIEIGNHDVLEFMAAGVPHKIAMIGVDRYPKERIIEDFKKIVEVTTKIFEEHPCKKGVGNDQIDYKDYTFMVTHIAAGGGGLEHLNSTSVIAPRDVYYSEAAYKRFLSLISHEYFHLWNVRRIRPQALMKFNYEEENYTDLLWVAEGFTSYYDDLLLFRAGLISEEEYLGIAASNMNRALNVAGNAIQSLRQSSFDAWIKFYRPNENSPNSTVSYYTKGAVVSMLLDLKIIDATKGKKSLDEVLRKLYTDYYKKGLGYTYSDIIKVCESVAGVELKEFFNKYIDGTSEIDPTTFFKPTEVILSNANLGKEDPKLGAIVLKLDGKFIVKQITRGSAAWNAGLNTNDELIAINGTRINDGLKEILKLYKPGETVEATVARDGKLRVLSVKLDKDSTVNYQLLPPEKPGPIYNSWLSKSK